MTNYRKIILFIILVIGNLYFLLTQCAFAKNQIELYFFYGEGCPYCAQMTVHLKEIQEQYPQLKINAFEVWHHPFNQKLLNTLAEAYQVKPTGVPVVFIGHLALEGVNKQVIWQIKEEVRRCSIAQCSSPIEKIKVVKDKKRELNWQNIGIFAGAIIFLFLLLNLLKKKKSG
ncbi:MAG: hypothetical protein N2259_01780 [Patescibacteria group bacterium]|nr:hypothetical protein [Patescibacteria group bacterium]